MSLDPREVVFFNLSQILSAAPFRVGKDQILSRTGGGLSVTGICSEKGEHYSLGLTVKEDADEVILPGTIRAVSTADGKFYGDEAPLVWRRLAWSSTCELTDLPEGEYKLVLFLRKP